MVITLLSLLCNLSYRMHSLCPLYVGVMLTIVLNKVKKVGAEQLL